MKLESLRDLFVDELKDLYSAEHQLLKALPKMAKAATAADLKRAFESHLKETKGQVERLEQVFATLDPVHLLNRIREAQRNRVPHEVGGENEKSGGSTPDLTRFVESLATAWRSGEVRATHRKQSSGVRTWRTRMDPFENVWPQVELWLDQQPDVTAKELLDRLQTQMPERFEPGQLRTLQRRVKEWRTAIVRRLVLGVRGEAEQALPAAETCVAGDDAAASTA